MVGGHEDTAMANRPRITKVDFASLETRVLALTEERRRARHGKREAGGALKRLESVSKAGRVAYLHAITGRYYHPKA